jgi:hypothetical protein
MNQLTKLIVVAILVSGGMVSQSTSAAKIQTPSTVRVTSVLTDAELFGGCFARLNVNQASLGLDCSFASVTFDCANSLGSTTRSSAERNFSQAQLAFVAEKNTQLVIDDSKKVNGLCFAERIDVLN